MQASISFVMRTGTIAALLCLLGCGPRGPKTYPVKGKVELAAGEIRRLAGAHVEAALSTDPTVRAWGVIGEDGRFALETRHAGVLRKGAREGSYQIRIILSDDNRAVQSVQRAALAPRYLQFETSGLTLQAPSRGETTLQVSQY